MIKVEVTKEFTLKDFDKLKNIVRKTVNEKGKLFVGDEFECDNEMFEYLTGKNPNEDVVVKLIEIIPEEKLITKKIKKTGKDENIIPLDNEKVEKVAEEIIKYVKPKTTKKKKTSKK